ncbi:Lrp/AsnC family transcriptional regulator [Rhodococcus aetherivorans]
MFTVLMFQRRLEPNPRQEELVRSERPDFARIHPPVLSRPSPHPSRPADSGGATSSNGSSSSVDSVDQQLIGYLLADCHATNRQLAQLTGISESAVSIRLKKLMSAGSLVFTALIDWESAGFEWFVIVRMRTVNRAPLDVANAISELDNCEAVSVVLGTYDLLAYFLVRDSVELHQLINHELPAIDGVGDYVTDITTQSSVTTRGRQFFMVRNAAPIRLPAPALDIDDLDITLIQALVTDSRQSSRAIARSLGVAEGTIRARIDRLDRSGLCRIAAMAEPISMGYAGVIAHVSLIVDRTELDSIREKLLAMPETVFLATTIGPAALALTLVASDQHQLIDLVARDIRAITGVNGTEVLPMMDVVRFSPYLKRLT